MAAERAAGMEAEAEAMEMTTSVEETLSLDPYQEPVRLRCGTVVEHPLVKLAPLLRVLTELTPGCTVTVDDAASVQPPRALTVTSKGHGEFEYRAHEVGRATVTHTACVRTPQQAERLMHVRVKFLVTGIVSFQVAPCLYLGGSASFPEHPGMG